MNLTLTLEQPAKKLALFGTSDKHLRMIRDLLGVQVVSRDDSLRLSGEKDSVSHAAAVIDQMQRKLRRQEYLTADDIKEAIKSTQRGLDEDDDSPKSGGLDVFAKGNSILAKTAGQQKYIDAMFKHDLTFCLGPAGTGKTYLAVAVAASLLKAGKAKRVILARPAVEAGERLGFLPGDLQAKVNPYLRPLFDAMNDMMDPEQFKRLMMGDVIEVVPLAFMRGRTLNDSVIILDEAQNTTPTQMLMFLTRMGYGSKMIVTGDASQVDLPSNVESGLIDAVNRLEGTDGIAVIELQRSDIVRHKLVQSIVNAYEDSNAIK